MIALVDYGAGNLRSVEFALERIGASWRRVSEPAQLGGASRVILPGVGAAESAMQALASRRLDRALRASELPLLGICLGMQLLTEQSEEGGRSIPCLGLLEGRTRRIRTDEAGEALPLPHIGWNDTRLEADPLFRGLGPDPHFYYLHSFRVDVPAAHVIARVSYGERFPAAVRDGRRVAVQFHPEKSGEAGLRVLANFCEREDGA